MNWEAPPNSPMDEEMGEGNRTSIGSHQQRSLNYGKAPGIDQITAELLKLDTGSKCVELRRLLDVI